MPTPEGPFQLIDGAQYEAERKAANAANRAIRQQQRHPEVEGALYVSRMDHTYCARAIRTSALRTMSSWLDLAKPLRQRLRVAIE